MEQDYSIKLVSIGDGAVGKTCLLNSFAHNKFPDDYLPTVFDNYQANVVWNDKLISLSLWDTAGQDDYESLRKYSYPDTEVFLLCYSIVNPSSFGNIKNKWENEIKKHCPGVPIVLVGTKLDLREDIVTLIILREKEESPITTEMGIELQKDIGAFGFIECSALSQKNVKQVFEMAIESVIKEMKKDNDKQPSKNIFSSISTSEQLDDDISRFNKKIQK